MTDRNRFKLGQFVAICCFVLFWFPNYSNKKDNWFKDNKLLQLGVPGSPWFEYGSGSNPIEGFRHQEIFPLSLSWLVMVVGVLCFFLSWADWRLSRTGEKERLIKDETRTPPIEI